MAPSPLDQFKALVNSMLASGLLDDYFKTVQKLQDEVSPDFISEVVTAFNMDGERVLCELTTLLDKPVLDFVQVMDLVHQLKGCSSSVGACRVKNACVELRTFGNQRNVQGCRNSLVKAKVEFCQVRDKFKIMLQLLRQVKGLAPK